MTTQTWVSAIAHSNDADFRAWGSELSGKLAAAGLVKHTDTGQINWSTVTRPAASTAGGFEIWRFDDSLQATAPIYLKIEYGSGNNAAHPQIWLTVGTGTNGSGTLNGTVSDRNPVAFSGAASAGNYPSYLCVAAGFVGLLHKSGASGSSTGFAFFAVSRTHDTAGDATGNGFFVLWGAPSAAMACNSQSVRTAATAVAYTASNIYTCVPGQPAGSLVGADYQVYPVMGIGPRVYVHPTLATVIASEVPAGTTFSVAMVGAAARTLLSVGSGFRCVVAGTGSGSIGTYGIAMLWE